LRNSYPRGEGLGILNLAGGSNTTPSGLRVSLRETRKTLNFSPKQETDGISVGLLLRAGGLLPNSLGHLKVFVLPIPNNAFTFCSVLPRPLSHLGTHPFLVTLVLHGPEAKQT